VSRSTGIACSSDCSRENPPDSGPKIGDYLTIAAKGGGNTIGVSGIGGSGSDTGGYAGGMLQWYVVPNVSLSGAVDYVEFTGVNSTSETVKLEWLFSQTMPVSIYGGYEHADLNASSFGNLGSGDFFFVGIKLYMNGSGAGTLVDRQRSGSLGYIAQAPTLGLSTN